MRRTMWLLGGLLAVLAGVAIGVGAYHAGVTHGLTESGRASRVVQVVGPGFGFFPFGFFLFPLFIFLFVGLARGRFWRRRWYGPHGPGPMSHGAWEEGRREAFDHWHRRQHEGSAQAPTGDPDPGGSG